MMKSLRTQARLGTIRNRSPFSRAAGANVVSMRFSRLLDRKLREIRGDNAGVELGDVEQRLE